MYVYVIRGFLVNLNNYRALERNMTDRFKRQLEGFATSTIIMAIVFVGMLVLGIFLVQMLLERSRVNETIDTLNGVTAAVFAYQDRYGRIPGDDGPAATLAARGPGWAGVTAGNVNGQLDVGVNQAFTGAGESGPFWQQLKAARFISGEPGDLGRDALLENPWGGLVSVLGSNMGGDLDGNKVCISQVPGAAAITIDTELDDGDGTSGRLRATLGARGANTNPSNGVLSAAYTENSVYTLCYQL